MHASERLKEWIRENDTSGQLIDNGDGQVVRSTGGLTPGMHLTLAEEAADVLDMDLDDIRTMEQDRLIDLLKARLEPASKSPAGCPR